MIMDASTILYPPKGLLSPLLSSVELSSSPKLVLRQFVPAPPLPIQPMGLADCLEQIEVAKERAWPWRLPTSSTDHSSVSRTPPSSKNIRQPPNFPPEIWQQVFEACLPPKHDIDSPYPRLCALEAPLVLRRVCRRWDTAVLQTGSLWSSIHVSMSAKEHHDAHDRLEWIKSVVNKRPADFIFDHVSFKIRDEDSRWGPSYDEAFKILSIVFARCRVLDINLPHGLLTGGALRLIQRDPKSCIALPSTNLNPFPVKTPHLRGFRWANDISVNSLLPMALRLPWMSIGGHNPNFRLPISQLTTLALDCPMSLDDCLTLLSSCQGRLERLQLSAIDSSILGTLHRPLDLQQLRFMKIVSRVDLTPLFSKLTLRNLESIELVLTRANSKPQRLNIPWDQLIHLTLDSDISLPEMWNLLRRCPRIVTITHSSNMFDHVPPGEIQPIFLQNLSTIKLVARAGFSSGLSVTNQLEAPRLSIVHLPYIPSFLERLDPTSIGCLTTLKLSCLLAISMCRRILSSVPSLKNIDIITFTDSDSTDLGMVYANNLEEITITSTSNLEPLFTNFYAPELQSLTLKWDLDNGHEIPPLATFLDGIEGLQKLSFFNARFTEHMIMDCLAVVSDSLTHLQIEHTGESEEMTDITHLIRCLTWEDHVQIMCPQLETLKLSPCSSQDGALGAMVRSRQPGGPRHPTRPRCLDSVCIGFRTYQQHHEDLEHLVVFSTLGNILVNLI